MRRLTLIAFVSTLVGFGSWAVLMGPDYLAAYVNSRVSRRALAFGMSAHIGEVITNLSPNVGLREVLSKPLKGDAFALSVGSVDISSSIAWVERRISLDRVSIRDTRLEITDIEGFLSWAQQNNFRDPAGQETKKTGASFFRVDLHPLPTITMENMAISTPAGVARACAGKIVDRGLTTNTTLLSAQLACSFQVGDRLGNLELTADFDPDKKKAHLEARFAPPIEFMIGEQRVRVGGLRRLSNGKAEMTNVQLITTSLTAEARSIEFAPRDGVSLADLVTPLIRGEKPIKEILKKLEALNMDDVILYGPGDGNLSGRIRAALEGLLPSMLRSFPVALEEEEDLAGRSRTKKSEPAIHRYVLDSFDILKTKLAAALTLPSLLHAAVPIDRIRIRRARLVDRTRGEKDRNVLHHINAELTKDGPVLNAKIVFRTPATGEDRNVITVRADATAPALHAETTLRRVPLQPYAAFLPSWIKPDPRGAIHNVHLLFAADGDTQRARIEGSLGIENIALVAPAVSAVPIHFENLMVNIEVDLDSRQGRLNISNGSLWLGPAFLSWAGEVSDVPSNPRIKIKAHVEEVSANQAFLAIPSALVSTIRGARFAGTVGADLELQFRTLDLDALRLKFTPRGVDFKILDLGKSVQLETLFEPFVHRIETPTGPVSVLVGVGNELFVPFEEISPFLIHAITTTEDATFFKHAGFAGFAIRRSIVQDLKKGAFVRGASTISQQTVKNLFLSHEKTISRKVQEAIITHALEENLSKEKILEIYFNIIEWGPDIFGLGQAARFYFDKSPQELDLTDCLFLVSLIPAPRLYIREFERGKISTTWQRRLGNYARKMLERKKISLAEYEAHKPFDPLFRGRDIIDVLPPPQPAQEP